MKTSATVKISAAMLMTAVFCSNLFSQEPGRQNSAGEAPSGGSGGKAASQTAVVPPEKIEAAIKTIEGIIQNTNFGAEREKKIAELLKKLADNSFQVREKATEELSGESNEIAALVEKAALESDDAEVKMRCDVILKAVKTRGSSAGVQVGNAVDTLVQAGQTKVIGMLIELLNHRDVTVRTAAFQSLSRLTGESLEYKLSADDEKRKQAVEKWKDWWEKNKATFVFKRLIQTGVIWCDVEKKCVTAYSMSGETLWTRSYEDPPSSAVGLPNGNFLVAFRAEPGYAVEYDSDGKEVWSTKGFKLDANGICAEASRTVGGNTLLAFPHDGKVIEVTPQGKVAFQLSDLGHPHAAQPTADGNIMVMEHMPLKLTVFNHDGKTVTSIKVEGSCVDAVPLPNGHFLVCSLTEPFIQEFDADSNSVWTRQCSAKVSTAIRLGDGNTVMSSGAEGLIIVNPEGELVKAIIKQVNYNPWTGKVRLLSQLPAKGAATAPAASKPAAAPAPNTPPPAQNQR